MKKRSASDSVIANRVQDVFNMMMESKSSATIIATIREKYDVSAATVGRDTTRALKMLKKQLAIKKADKVLKAVGQREHIIEKLMDSEQYAMASQALADKNKLENLYEQDHIEPGVVIEVVQE